MFGGVCFLRIYGGRIQNVYVFAAFNQLREVYIHFQNEMIQPITRNYIFFTGFLEVHKTRMNAKFFFVRQTTKQNKIQK